MSTYTPTHRAAGPADIGTDTTYVSGHQAYALPLIASPHR